MASESGSTRRGRVIVAGEARGEALVLDHGLSFAMGFDVAEGRISDVHSSFAGERLGGKVLVMPSGRGSSSASTSFAEALRLGTGPAGVVLLEVDEILAIGAIVARTLYGTICPIVVAPPVDFAAITTGATVGIEADGSIEIS